MGVCVSTEAPPAPVRLEAPSKSTSRLPVVADASFASSNSKDLSSAASSTDSTTSTNPGGPTQLQDLLLKYSALQVGELLGTSPHGAVAAGTLRGADVAVRTFSTPPAKATLRQAAESAAALRHPHVLQVLGYCIDPPALVLERCVRGSLADVLAAARDEPAAAAELTWSRRLRMLGDIAAGMAFLHGRSPAVVHGNLKASKCLVNGAWMVKIDVAPGGRSPAAPPATPAADLLAFGLIMWEVLTWEASENNLEPVEVSSGSDGPEEVKLALPKLTSFPGPPPASERSLARYLSLMEKCLHPECIKGADADCCIDFVRVLRELTGLAVLER